MRTKPGVDPYFMKSCIPASTSRTVKADNIGGWGSGLGNNVSNTANGVNAAPNQMAEELDKTAGDRAAKHLAMRKTDAWKMRRAKEKRVAKAKFRSNHHDITSDRQRPLVDIRDWGVQVVRKPTIVTQAADIDTWSRRTVAAALAAKK